MATSLAKNRKKKLTKDESIVLAKNLIQPVAEVEDWLTMLIFGRGGAGKTTLAASSGLKTLIIDFNERGTLSVKRNPNVSVYRVEYWYQLDWVYWYLKSGKHDFKVAVLDTVTSMAILGMKWVLGDDATRDANRDPLMPSKQSYGKLAQVLQTSFYNWRNLDMHVIFTAHERTTYSDDEEGESTLVETHPALSPAPREALISIVQIVGRLYKKEVTQKQKQGPPKKRTERRLLVGTDDRYVTKLRQDPTSAVLVPRVVRNPTLKYFLDTVLPTLEKEENGEEDREEE
jgi:phage nucleotide-binding protein